MKGLGTKELQTDRLILRRFRLKDANEAYKNWMSRDQVTKFLTWKTNESEKESAATIKSWVENYEDLNFYQWAIETKEKKELIGSISIVRIDEKIEMMGVGYCIGDRWWHKGYTSEALKRVVKFAFEEVGANRFEARHDLKNPNSGKVMEKSKMIYEGTLRKSAMSNSGLGDMAIYSILRKDYKKGD